MQLRTVRRETYKINGQWSQAVASAQRMLRSFNPLSAKGNISKKNCLLFSRFNHDRRCGGGGDEPGKSTDLQSCRISLRPKSQVSTGTWKTFTCLGIRSLRAFKYILVFSITAAMTSHGLFDFPSLIFENESCECAPMCFFVITVHLIIWEAGNENYRLQPFCLATVVLFCTQGTRFGLQ